MTDQAHLPSAWQELASRWSMQPSFATQAPVGQAMPSTQAMSRASQLQPLAESATQVELSACLTQVAFPALTW